MPMRKTTRRRVSVLAAIAAVSAVAVTAPAALADTAAAPAAPSVHLKLFAAAPAGLKNPDDITLLGNELFAAYQNNATSDGSPVGSKSTVVAFNRVTGAVEHTYDIPGKVDGLTADTQHHRVLASVNEDLNSSLYSISFENGAEIKHYTYSPSPAETGTDGTNGGTDAISIAPNGTIYIAHSNPDSSLPGANNTAAVYTVKLDGSTAALTPLFGVNDTVPVINPAAGAPTSAPMGLTDPDSNRFIQGPNGGTLIQDAQADSKLVFVKNLGANTPALSQLNLTNAVTPSQGAATPQLDDIEQVDGPGTLFVADQGTGSIYQAATDGVPAGTLFASQPKPKADDLPNDPALAVVDTHTGVVTHISTDVNLVNPKGLLFVRSANN